MTSALAVFVGVATEDSIAVVDRYPGADERIVASGMVFGGGGPAATAAVTAARLGVPSAAIAAVGEDEAADRVRERLRSEGVDISGIVTVPGAETSRSIVVISGAERSRAIVNRVGPALEVSGDPRALELVAGARWVHVDQHGWRAVHNARERVGSGIRLSIDAGNHIPGLNLHDTALYAPTREALERRYGAVGIADGMRRALAEGAGAVVVTDGGRGSHGLRADGTAVFAAPPAVQLVSTLGAGDVFHGALIAALIRNEDGTLEGGFERAVAYATVVATLSCRGIDGRSSIPDHDETMRVLTAAEADARTVREAV
ncbi:PfkB family carbohydrate kinase [uncultured Microbacterium sp.]|uniref:carbohydrate kinase family protein n=1 Tax=uncultured Microbacterium sp. TaxID=191216 RepID=UPI00262ADCF1|nr:PfkB family carbohydrate kinase [uncultured Microbacterium sp.]